MCISLWFLFGLVHRQLLSPFAAIRRHPPLCVTVCSRPLPLNTIQSYQLPLFTKSSSSATISPSSATIRRRPPTTGFGVPLRATAPPVPEPNTRPRVASSPLRTGACSPCATFYCSERRWSPEATLVKVPLGFLVFLYCCSISSLFTKVNGWRLLTAWGGVCLWSLCLHEVAFAAMYMLFVLSAMSFHTCIVYLPLSMLDGNLLVCCNL